MNWKEAIEEWPIGTQVDYLYRTCVVTGYRFYRYSVDELECVEVQYWDGLGRLRSGTIDPRALKAVARYVHRPEVACENV